MGVKPDKKRWLNATVRRACPLCAGTEALLASSKMQLGLDLPTVACVRCGFVFTNPMPPREVYERFYIEAYAQFYGHITPPPPASQVPPREPPSLRAKFEQLDKLRPLRGLRLLELGPGQGLFLWWAQQRGCSVLGIEPSPEFCSVLAQAGLPHRRCSLDEVEVGTVGQFDIIAMFHVLEHFFDPNEALQQCRSLLAPGGLLAVEVPNILKPFRSLDRYFLRYVHPSSFSPATLEAMLAKHGFRAVFVDTAGDDWRSPQNLFILAEKLPQDPELIQIPSTPSYTILKQLGQYRWRWYSQTVFKWHARSAYRSAYHYARQHVPQPLRRTLKKLVRR